MVKHMQDFSMIQVGIQARTVENAQYMPRHIITTSVGAGDTGGKRLENFVGTDSSTGIQRRVRWFCEDESAMTLIITAGH